MVFFFYFDFFLILRSVIFDLVIENLISYIFYFKILYLRICIMMVCIGWIYCLMKEENGLMCRVMRRLVESLSIFGRCLRMIFLVF